MKPITPPSLRERRRYLVFEVICGESVCGESRGDAGDERVCSGERIAGEKEDGKESVNEKAEGEAFERGEALSSEALRHRSVSARALLRAIWEALYSLYGDTGVSECGIWLIDYDEARGVGILRCAHTKVDAVRAALACIHEVEGKQVCIRVVRTSGTIKSARKRSKRILPFRFPEIGQQMKSENKA